MIRLLVGIIGFGVLATAALAADPVEIGIGYLRRAAIKPALSLVEQPAENDGVAGVRLAQRALGDANRRAAAVAISQKKNRIVPHGPDESRNDGSRSEPVSFGQLRYKKSSPAYFLPKYSSAIPNDRDRRSKDEVQGDVCPGKPGSPKPKFRPFRHPGTKGSE